MGLLPDHFPYSVAIPKVIWHSMGLNTDSDHENLLQWCRDNLGECHLYTDPGATPQGDWCVTWRYASVLEYTPVIHVKTLDHALLVQLTWT